MTMRTCNGTFTNFRLQHLEVRSGALQLLQQVAPPATTRQGNPSNRAMHAHFRRDICIDSSLLQNYLASAPCSGCSQAVAVLSWVASASSPSERRCLFFRLVTAETLAAGLSTCT